MRRVRLNGMRSDVSWRGPGEAIRRRSIAPIARTAGMSADAPGRGVIATAHGLEAALDLPNAEGVALCLFDGDRETSRDRARARRRRRFFAASRPASARARITAFASTGRSIRRAAIASTIRSCSPTLTPTPSTGRSASTPRCSRSARTAARTRPRRSPARRPRASRDASASRPRRSSSTSSTCAASRASIRRFPKRRAAPSRASPIPPRSRISRRSASPRSRSCRPTRSSTSAIWRRSASRTHGATIRSCSARPTRALRPAAGRRCARRPTRCMRPAWRRFSTSSSTITARATSSGRPCRSAASTTRPSSASTRTTRLSTSTTQAPAIASRSTGRWSSTWRSARSGAGWSTAGSTASASIWRRRSDAAPHGFDPHAPFFQALAEDPIVSKARLIAEPWDIGPGGYQLGRFGPDWAEWNDHFRDAARRFWRGDAGFRGEIATRLAGSRDVFADAAAPSKSVNFVVAHDGFTLADLVSYDRKHNEANGENNRDGTDANYSWNHGVEGPSDDPDGRRGPGARPAQSLDRAVRLARDADAGDGRRARLQPGRQQQRLRPGQRFDGDRLDARRRGACRVSRAGSLASAAPIPPCRATPFSPGSLSTRPAFPTSNGATPTGR